MNRAAFENETPSALRIKSTFALILLISSTINFGVKDLFIVHASKN